MSIEEGDYIETNARWGKRFVEILDPTKKNEILRVYFEQPQRQWVGLTSDNFNDFNPLFKAEEAVRWAEAKLKEKNT